MKKAEIEAAVESYKAGMIRALEARASGNFAGAVRESMSVWEFIDAKLKHERQQSREPNRVAALDIVAECAPAAMDYRSLQSMEEFLEQNKRLAKLADGRPHELLVEARARLWDCHRLWSEIEREPNLLQSSLVDRLGKTAAHWRGIVSDWETMGLLRREPEGSSFRLSLATRLGAIMPGKCPNCGRVEECPKGMLLDTLTCPECDASVSFVIMETMSTKG